MQRSQLYIASRAPCTVQVFYQQKGVMNISTVNRWVFSNALSYLPLHNHLVRAYREAGIPSPSQFKWRIPARLVPTKVHEHIKPEWVIPGIKQQIKDARIALDGMQPSLDREEIITVHFTPDRSRPDRDLHPSIKVIRQDVPTGYSAGWVYTYNPYALGRALLAEYEAFIDQTMSHPRWTPFIKLARIIQKAKKLSKSGDLVASNLSHAGR